MSMPKPATWDGLRWSVESDTGRFTYTISAPGAMLLGSDDGKRTDWKASWWDNHDAKLGDLRRGDTLEDVLIIFPERQAAKFRQVISRELV